MTKLLHNNDKKKKNFVTKRKRLIMSINFFFIGLGLLAYTIYYSISNLSGGLNAVFNMIVYLITGYISLILSQILLFSEVWKIGTILNHLEVVQVE